MVTKSLDTEPHVLEAAEKDTLRSISPFNRLAIRNALEDDRSHCVRSSRSQTAGMPLDLRRHRRKCVICRHKKREAIEEAFIHWHSPQYIAIGFRVSERTLYRHAHALDLFSRRQGKVRSALEHILERAEEAEVTADSVIRAVRAYACLHDDGRWVEPASNVVFSSSLRPLAGSTLQVGAAIASGQAVPRRKRLLSATRARPRKSAPRRRKSNRQSGD